MNTTLVRYGGDSGVDVPLQSSLAFSAIESEASWQEWPDLTATKYYTASTAGVLVRNAEGDWSINRTSGGAETHTFGARVPVKKIVASQGWKLTKIHMAYQLGVADITSLDVHCDSVAYVDQTAPAVTANHGGTIGTTTNYDTNHNTAAKRIDYDASVSGENLLVVTLPTPVFFSTDDAVVEVEAVFVLANTCTLKFRGFGLEYTRTL